MKYSLKNRQFKKRNQIFGERRREDNSAEDNHDQGLQEIPESWQEHGQGEIKSKRQAPNSKQKVYQFIDFQGNVQEGRSSPFNQLKRIINDHRPGLHGLSPINKPLLNNANIRLAQSTVRSIQSRNFQIENQIVSFCFKPEKKADSSLELKAAILKLYSILIKNNSRIDQLQSIVSTILNRGQLIAKQITQGMKTALKMEQQTDLFFNTMRSVYQNLRICKLKQQNLQLYFKQDSTIRGESVEAYHDETVKYTRPKYSLASKQFEEEHHDQDQKESRELVKLVDYQSDTSFQELNFSEDPDGDEYYEEPNMCKKKPQSPQEDNFLDQMPYQREEPNSNYNQFQQLSPFEANRMISVHHQSSIHSHSPSFQQSPSDYPQSQFQTFRLKDEPQHGGEYERMKTWLLRSNQSGLKCWLDGMGCLRRPNSTYIFSEKGAVMAVSAGVFGRLTGEGLLLGSVGDGV